MELAFGHNSVVHQFLKLMHVVFAPFRAVSVDHKPSLRIALRTKSVLDIFVQRSIFRDECIDSPVKVCLLAFGWLFALKIEFPALQATLRSGWDHLKYAEILGAWRNEKCRVGPQPGIDRLFN